MSALWRFAKLDAWGSFKFAVLMIWLPIFVIGWASADWSAQLLLGWAKFLPLFWLAGIIVRGLWFYRFYRTNTTLEDDYKRFTVKK